MEQKIQTSQKHLLVVPNLELQSSRRFLLLLWQIVAKMPAIRCFTFEKYPQGQSTVIQKSDTQTLNNIGMVIVIGQNRDLMQTFHYFTNRNSVPIFGFGSSNDYSSPLIYNFSPMQFDVDLLKFVLSENDWANVPCSDLMKLSVTVDCVRMAEATCQIEIHRGMTQSILILNIYLQNKMECGQQKIKIGQFKGDGILISTPMGSFCKSLSLNGPLMDRTMENILITPICPLSMKFRPLCLPSNSRIFIQLDERCRTQKAEIYFDENSSNGILQKGQFMRVKMSKYKTRMVANLVQTSQEFFIKSLRNVLRWGEGYSPIQQQGLLIRHMQSL